MKQNIVVIAALLIGLGIGYMIKPAEHSKPQKQERKVKYWVAPMNPKYRRDKPGKSPMGMDLVPVYADGDSSSDDNQNSIKINPRVVDNLGVVTKKVEKNPFAREVDTVGYVVPNENDIESVHTYVDGWVRNLKVNAVGDVVKKGQVLFELYSPTLVSAQQEYLLALKNQSTSLINASKNKLKTLGLNEEQIKQLRLSRKAQNQVSIYSNTSGIVSKLNLRDGKYVKPGNNLMVIEDLSSIWVKVEVPEKQANWVKIHQMANATFVGMPGKVWQGEVIYIYPALNKTTHTLGVRLRFPNPNYELKLDMYAVVKIFVPKLKKKMVVPSQAVIRKGDGNHVILALGKGRFRPQMVTLGEESNGKVIVLKGLNVGDDVVVSGQFLIDSESNLSAAFERLDPHKQHHHQQQSKDKAKDTKIYYGKILSINTSRHRITLSHAPIKSLGMPEMVMEVPVEKSISLDNFKVGQKVQFKLKEKTPMHYSVQQLKLTK